jgi:hypothetical protein
MDEPGRRQDGFVEAFESAFGRLRMRIETACAGQSDWPLGTAAAINAALELAAAEPGAVSILITDALADGKSGFAHYERLISYLCDLLRSGRKQRPEAEGLPAETERALAGGVAMLVAQRVDLGRHSELPGLAPEAIQFVLTPYLGMDEARRVAELRR